MGRRRAIRPVAIRSTAIRSTAVRLLAAGAVVTLSLAGCGVSGTGPTDEGDAAVIGAPATDAERKDPPSPDSASSTEGLVDDYLKAAVGGGKPAIDQVRAFLNEHALASWVNPVNPENPQLTVIRVVRGPITGAATGNRTPVTVEYQVVGILSDQGRIDNLADLVTRTMTFWVVPDKDDRRSLRVDEIDDAPPGLLLSDTALTEYYRIQPIYFWDQNYSVLVPDVRYVPLTITPDLRAGQLVQWLVAGSSSWVTNAQRPPGIAADRVVSENGTLVVKLTAETALDEESLRRLYFQLQWTLRTPTGTPTMKLRIDDKDVTVPAGTDDYLRFNLSYGFRGSGQRYDIIDGKVVQVPPAATPSGALAAGENQSVVYAAVTRGGAAAAFVRSDGQGRRYLRIVHENAVVGAKLPVATSTTLTSRPAFIPNSPDSLMKDSLMIAWGGRLFAVSGIDGTATDVTRVSGVTAVSVSPDGRRIAFVASKQVYVASLILANNAITLGPVRPVLSGQIDATSVAWTSESWLDVAGTAIGGGPALWRVAADSVVAQNLSDKLAGVTVFDLLAYPQWPSPSNTDVLLTTDRGVYTFFNNLTPAGDVKAPFFGT